MKVENWWPQFSTQYLGFLSLRHEYLSQITLEMAVYCSVDGRGSIRWKCCTHSRIKVRLTLSTMWFVLTASCSWGENTGSSMLLMSKFNAAYTHYSIKLLMIYTTHARFTCFEGVSSKSILGFFGWGEYSSIYNIILYSACNWLSNLTSQLAHSFCGIVHSTFFGLDTRLLSFIHSWKKTID